MKKEYSIQPIILPALRGVMGDWVYYTTLVRMDEVGARVSFAGEIHQNQNLSDMIQRQLKRNRGAEIARYINEQEERFFNSLIVATYGGAPNWHAVSSVGSSSGDQLNVEQLSEETLASVGFLELSGEERLFAIDGQHRLAGIKKALKEGGDTQSTDELSVIFVAHKETEAGLQRTRRLFTTLNKTAKPVSKGDIIALDEDDVMAICARHLIENTEKLGGSRVAFVASINMPISNFESLTTIGNLYDVLTILFTKFPSDLRQSKASLTRSRPSEEKLRKYFLYAERFVSLLGEYFEELNEFFGTDDPEAVVRKHRGNQGGNALYRPIGITIFVEVILRLTKIHSLEDSVEIAAKLPRNLREAPFLGLMWDPNTRTILNAHKVTLREVLCYMVGAPQTSSKYTEKLLIERYSNALGVSDVSLPDKVL